ncbi:MAG: adenosylmethionine-8-amino-7-oxononanoate aminotransferase [Planctomycetota bacterium]
MPNSITGSVAKVGAKGQLITDISVAQVADAPHDENFQVKFGGHETFGLFPTEHQQPASTMVASEGASGFIEIEIVGISLSEMLGIRENEAVEVIWPSA